MERKRSDFKFEIALSFAGEQRGYVDEFAAELKVLDIKVFYDTYEKVSLWGKDIFQYLNDIYKNQCLFTIVFISEDYAAKRWTKHELKSAQARAFNENAEYILPVRFDNTELPGLNETIGYLSIEGMTPKELATLTQEKLNQFGDPDENKDFEKVEIADYKKLTAIQRTNPADLIGRKDDLEKLHNLLTENQRVVVVNGMGGIGKTTLAAAYTFQYHDYYKKLVWITQSQEDITNDFIQNEQLIQSLKIDTEGKQADQLFAEILHTLSNIRERPKLLVIDNAFEGLEAHLDKLPSQPEWEVLVTSRQAIEGLYTMPLDFLSNAEAVALFQKHCSYITDLEEIKTLVKAVEFHTLTIEILAKTAQKQRTSPVELKEALENNLKTNVKTAHSQKNQIKRVTSYLSTIFDLSTLTENETWLLKNFCALPSEFHNYDLLLKLIEPEASNRNENFAETLQNLVQKGWLLKDDTGDRYRIHRVIMEIALNKLDITAEDIESLASNIANELYLNEAKENPVDKFQWIPFGQTCLKIWAVKDSSSYSTILCDLGLRHKDLGDFEHARLLLERAVEFDEQNTNEGEVTRSHTGLGMVLEFLGDYKEAKTLFEKVVKFYEKVHGKQHSETAISYSNLALLLQDLGDYKGAKALLEKALISNEKNFGEEHPSTAISYSNLALVLKDLGDYSGARTLLEKVLISDEKNFGEEHPSTAGSYSNLALLLQGLGDYLGAKALLEKALISYEKNFGEEHPSTAIGYSNIATVLQNLREYIRAIELCKKALLIGRRTLPEGHPSIKVREEKLEWIKQAAREVGYDVD